MLLFPLIKLSTKDPHREVSNCFFEVTATGSSRSLRQQNDISSWNSSHFNAYDLPYIFLK